MTEIGLNDLTEDWAAVKLRPDRTGLSRAIWITENQGYPHDVRVKVSRLRSGRGSWPDAVFVSGRPGCAEIVRAGHQPWITLNRDVIIDFWNGVVDYLEASARLQRLP